MDLKTVLQQTMFTGLSDADALAAGNALVTKTSSKLWAWSDVVKDQRFGKTLADTLYGAILQHDGQPAASQYVTYGIDLSLAETQAGLDIIAAAIPDLAAVCGQFKLLGVWTESSWQSWGIAQPTLADITAAMAATAATQAVITFRNECLNPLLSDETKTLAEIKAAIAAYGG